MFLLKPFDKRWRTMPSELCMQCPRFTELCRQDLIRSSIGEYMSCRHCPLRFYYSLTVTFFPVYLTTFALEVSSGLSVAVVIPGV